MSDLDLAALESEGREREREGMREAVNTGEGRHKLNDMKQSRQRERQKKCIIGVPLAALT